MDHPALQVLMRLIHLVSFALAVGGMACLVLCVRPATRLLDDSFRDALSRMVQRQFDRVILVAIGGFLLSGSYNWYLLNDVYSAMRLGADPAAGARGVPIGQMLIGIKVLLAVVLFALVLLRQWGLLPQRRFWLTLNLHLALLIGVLAGVLHYLRLEHLKGH